MVDLVKRAVDRATQDTAREQRQEREANEADARRTEQPNDRPEGER